MRMMSQTLMKHGCRVVAVCLHVGFLLYLSPSSVLAEVEGSNAEDVSSEALLAQDREAVQAMLASEVPDATKTLLLRTIIREGDSRERVIAILGEPSMSRLLGVWIDSHINFNDLTVITVTYTDGVHSVRVGDMQRFQRGNMQRFPRGNQNSNF